MCIVIAYIHLRHSLFIDENQLNNSHPFRSMTKIQNWNAAWHKFSANSTAQLWVTKMNCDESSINFNFVVRRLGYTEWSAIARSNYLYLFIICDAEYVFCVNLRFRFCIFEHSNLTFIHSIRCLWSFVELIRRKNSRAHEFWGISNQSQIDYNHTIKLITQDYPGSRTSFGNRISLTVGLLRRVQRLIIIDLCNCKLPKSNINSDRVIYCIITSVNRAKKSKL